MKEIGYLGLGSMGSGMSGNLIDKSGQTVLGFDPVDVLLEAFAERGGKAAKSAAEIYETCDIIFLCLPTNEIMKNTVDEILATARPGTIVCDMGSTSPYIVRELHDLAIEKEIYLLDTPVSGGKVGADNGTLAIMCGGEKEIFDVAKPYLEMMGSTVTYMGLTGCGSIAKVANNMMVGVHMMAAGEAFAFAKKAGLDPAVLFEAIKDGFAQSAVMDQKIPKVLKRDFEPTARTAVHYKDIKNAMELAEHLGVDLPLTSLVMDDMHWIEDNGMINEDHCALMKYLEEKIGATIE